MCFDVAVPGVFTAEARWVKGSPPDSGVLFDFCLCSSSYLQGTIQGFRSSRDGEAINKSSAPVLLSDVFGVFPV